MNSQLLVDAIARQSLVFMSQVSSAEGAESPLQRAADEVFVSVVRELEEQGLGEKVIAGMFGLALRAYRRKVQRLAESVTSRGVTLWGAIHAFLSERGEATRAEIRGRFAGDEKQAVRGVLDDLVDCGLVRRRGRGKHARYRAATPERLAALGRSGARNSPETNQALVWVHVCRAGPLGKDRLAELLPLAPALLEDALAALVADGRVRAEEGPDGLRYATDRCLIPVGETAGWEAAVIDHHRAVLNALAAKITSGQHGSAANDEVGGTTVSYDLWPGHPKEQEVRELLAGTRRRIAELWQEVEDQNQGRASAVTYKITFYCGQYRTEDDRST